MYKILKTVLFQSALVYLDDIIVFSKSIDDHIEHLATVFRLLAFAGLKLKLNKCEFFKNTIDFLGHVVSPQGISPNEKKVISIKKYPVPKNVKEVSSFLGLASYYRKFIRAFAEKAHSLTKLTRKNVAWEWGNEQQKAFDGIKDCLVTNPILRYPDFTREFIIYTDASGYGIGAVLAQMQRSPHSADINDISSDQEVVIAYSSKHLNDRQAKWSTTEKEAYAIIHAIDVFRPYLYGRRFTVVTDHKPLEWLMTKVEPSGRLARWALKIQEFDIAIGYRPGKTNQNADCLSRMPMRSVAVITPQKNNDWVDAQRSDEFCKKIVENIKKGIVTEYKLDPVTDILVDNEGRFVVPTRKTMELIYMNHDHMLAGHLGVAKTYARLLRQYVWPGMKRDVEQHVKACLVCAKRKAYGSRKAPLHPMPPAERVWEKIAMDIVGPVTESNNGNRYILVLSDYASRFVITIPMEDQKARTVAAHFVKEVITKYGAPECVLTDQGTNFLSKLIRDICELFKIKQTRTTSYHPQTDGLVERFNRTLCDMLACYVSDEPDLWDKYLPFVTLAYNTSQQSSINNCPFYLFYGRDPILPNDVVVNRRYRYVENDNIVYTQQWQKGLELARKHLAAAQHKQKRYYDEGSKTVEFKVNDIVLLKAHSTPGKFNCRWNGPYRIIRKLSDLNFEILKLETGLPYNPTRIPTTLVVHANRLKKQTKSVTADLEYRQQESINRQICVDNRPKLNRDVTETPVIIKPKNRVGRPPKQSETVHTDNTANTQPKRRVGRPPKNRQTTNTVVNGPQSPKRGVGRPRKIRPIELYPRSDEAYRVVDRTPFEESRTHKDERHEPRTILPNHQNSHRYNLRPVTRNVQRY
jgi:transposase InsO family protein